MGSKQKVLLNPQSTPRAGENGKRDKCHVQERSVLPRNRLVFTDLLWSWQLNSAPPSHLNVKRYKRHKRQGQILLWSSWEDSSGPATSYAPQSRKGSHPSRTEALFSSTSHHRARYRLESKSPPRLHSSASAATNTAREPSAQSPAADHSLRFHLFPLAGQNSLTVCALGQRYFHGGETSLALPARTSRMPYAPEYIPHQRFCD